MSVQDLFKGCDATVVRAIWEAYESERPEVGLAFEEWTQAQAARLGVPVSKVRQVTALATEYYLKGVGDGIREQALGVARVLGATFAKSIARLNDCLDAKKRRPLTDKDGRMVRGDDGEIQWIETEDWPTVRQASMDIIKVLGGMPAEKHEVENRNLTVTLEGSELIKEYQRVSDNLNRLFDRLPGAATANRGRKAIGAVHDGGAGGKGQVLLVDGVHQDEGRAGPAGTVQAVPSQGLPAADAGLPRQRAKPSQVHQEEPHNAGQLGGDGLGGAHRVHQAGDEGGHPEQR